MSVSSMTRTKDSKAVYVLFEDGDKKAEIALPDCRFVSGRGFSYFRYGQYNGRG